MEDLLFSTFFFLFQHNQETVWKRSSTLFWHIWDKILENENIWRNSSPTSADNMPGSDVKLKDILTQKFGQFLFHELDLLETLRSLSWNSVSFTSLGLFVMVRSLSSSWVSITSLGIMHEAGTLWQDRVSFTKLGLFD